MQNLESRTWKGTDAAPIERAAPSNNSRFEVPDPPIPSLSGFRPPCPNPGSDSSSVVSWCLGGEKNKIPPRLPGHLILAPRF